MPLDRDNAFFNYKPTAPAATAAPVAPTPAELQTTVAKLGAGKPLTPAEQTTISSQPATTPTVIKPTPTPIKNVTGKVPAGFTEGAFPAELEQYFGSSSGYAGYKIDSFTDENGTTYYQLSVATGPSSSQTFGASFTNKGGKYTPYSPTAKPVNSGGPNNPLNVNVPKEISNETRDAFAMLTNLFNSYGLGSLASEIAGYMTSGLTASEALIKLKTNTSGAYAERFAGNFARTKKGLNVISEAAYIDLENSYAETLKAYGLNNMLSTDSKQNAKQFASYIENDISAIEFKDRINTVQDRVVNADPAIKAMFKEFYPSLTNSDLISYFLNPTETIGKLKEKVTSAEIGAAFTGQGLTTSLAAASDFARYGIDRAGALQGAASIAGVLPEATKLGNIYGETGVTYNQQTGEQEFLKSSDEAKRKRNLLASKERASFEGSAGNAPGAYSTSYLKKSSTAGLI